MKSNSLIVQRLPILFATGLLSTGLLLSGCSDKDNAEDTAATNTQETKSEEPLTAAESEDILENEGVQITDDIADKDDTIITNDDINPLTAATDEPSLVTNPTKAGTPEDTVKQAFDTLYYGEAKDAVDYYKVDLANFEEELSKTQYAFQQTVEGITLTDTTYNADKTRATIDGELRLKGQEQPAPLSYELERVDGKWKILG